MEWPTVTTRRVAVKRAAWVTPPSWRSDSRPDNRFSTSVAGQASSASDFAVSTSTLWASTSPPRCWRAPFDDWAHLWPKAMRVACPSPPTALAKQWRCGWSTPCPTLRTVQRGCPGPSTRRLLSRCPDPPGVPRGSGRARLRRNGSPRRRDHWARRDDESRWQSDPPLGAGSGLLGGPRGAGRSVLGLVERTRDRSDRDANVVRPHCAGGPTVRSGNA